MENLGFTHWENMLDAQKDVLAIYRQDTKILFDLLTERIENAIEQDYFTRLDELNKIEGNYVTHGCNMWMENIITIYHEMLQQLMQYATKEDVEKFYKWRVDKKVKQHLRY